MFKTPGNFYKPVSKRSLFYQVKFLDKVWFPAGAILIDNTYPHGDELFICHSIHEMLSYLKDTYFYRGKNTQTSFFKISIYNLNADNENPLVDTTYRNSKDILCKHAYCRVLFLSPDLKEVYCEAFDICFDDHDMSAQFTYDYGILYGDYPKYENLDLVDSDFLRKSSYEYSWDVKECENYVIDGVPNADLDSKVNTGRDIYVCYRVWESMESYADYPCIEVYDGCLPVATFTKVGHAELLEIETE